MNDFETLTGLVSRYSPSGQEAEAVDWLVGRMRSLGYDEAFIDCAGNAVGVMGRGARQVLLLGHIDTVPGKIPMRLEETGNGGALLHGRGTVDAKGALACFVDSVAQSGARKDWQYVVIGAVDEERDSQGARFVAERYRPDFAIVGEPNRWERMALGYKGSAWAKVIVSCGQTHTASGVRTAVEVAIDAWLQVKAMAEAFNAGRHKMFDQVLPSLHELNSTVDDFEQQATMRLRARLPLDLPPLEWYARLEETLGQGRFGDGYRVVIERLGYAIPAWECGKNNPLVRGFLSSIRSLGGEPRFVYKSGTADLNVVAPVWQCPTLVYGPGDSTLDHTPDERLELDDFTHAVKVLRRVLKGLSPG